MARPKKNVTKAMIKQAVKEKLLFKKIASKHPLVNNPEYVAHVIEESTRKQEFFELDVNIDGSAAVHFMKWGEEELRCLWEGILYSSLSILRYQDNVKAVDEELNWIASQQFDDVSLQFELNSNEIRYLLTRYIDTSKLSLTSNKLIRAFRCLNEA